jgi:methyltransferase (TIGR00027 family)
VELAHEVSNTALITLRARVTEARRKDPLLQDPVGQELLEAISKHLGADPKRRLMARPLPSTICVHLALRARHYDRCARDFLRCHPKGLVVSLGAGFDTRFWRIGVDADQYVEVDLPDVVATKRQLLAEGLTFDTIGCSVLDHSWMEQIAARRQGPLLFLAEGLFMYLPKPQVIELFALLAERLSPSEMVFEVVHDRYTKGWWKKAVAAKMRRRLGTTAGASYDFGIQSAAEVASYGKDIRVVDEWSAFDEPDIRPAFLHALRHWSLMSRAQWTVQVRFGLEEAPLPGRHV